MHNNNTVHYSKRYGENIRQHILANYRFKMTNNYSVFHLKINLITKFTKDLEIIYYNHDKLIKTLNRIIEK